MPSGDQATARMPAVWPRNCRTSLPDSLSHMRNTQFTGSKTAPSLERIARRNS